MMDIVNRNVNDLIPYENNPRNNEEAVEYVKNSIREFGIQQPLVIDQNDVIVVGHTRQKACIELGIEEVPCVLADDLTDDQIKAYRIADNKTNEIATWDMDMLELELEEIDLDMSEFGIDADTNNASSNEEVEEDDYDMLLPHEAKAEYGQIYKLGRHRLMCGDSTKEEDVLNLMGDAKADIMFTDPPYGVAYVGKTKDQKTIVNDNLDEEALTEFIKKAFDNAAMVLREGAYVLQTIPSGITGLVFEIDWKNREWLRQRMIWLKQSMVLGHSEYHYKHEPILFGWIPGGERHKCDDRTKTSVWEFDRPMVSKEHPTMKPVKMWAYGIQNHTNAGDIAYEPFCGSGTSIVACEETGRSCYALELDPQYVDVIIERWERLTGQKAELLNE